MKPSTKKTKLENFVAEIGGGNTEILALLGLDESKFRYRSALENPHDEMCGVTRIREASGLSVFGMFDTVTVKRIGDDHVHYILHTVTSDFERVADLYLECCDKFGDPVYDDSLYAECTEENLMKVSLGSSDNLLRGTALMWPRPHCLVTVKYLTPSRYLSLSIDVAGSKKTYNHPRARTILDLVNLDISERQMMSFSKGRV